MDKISVQMVSTLCRMVLDKRIIKGNDLLGSMLGCALARLLLIAPIYRLPNSETC